MDQLRGLLPDCSNDLGMGVAGGVDRNPGSEVEEQVPVNVLDRQAVATNRNDRIGAWQAGRGPGLVERNVGASLRTGQLGDDVRNGPIPGDPRSGRRHGFTSSASA